MLLIYCCIKNGIVAVLIKKILQIILLTQIFGIILRFFITCSQLFLKNIIKNKEIVYNKVYELFFIHFNTLETALSV